MGIFSAIFGQTNAAIWASNDIAKPMVRGAVQASVEVLTKYRDRLKPESIEALGVILAMKFVHLYMHMFARLFAVHYGFQRLPQAKERLFEAIAFDFRKNFPACFPDWITFNQKFNDSYCKLDEILAKEDEPADVPAVFAVEMAWSIFESQEMDVIKDIGGTARKSFANLDLVPKLGKLAAHV